MNQAGPALIILAGLWFAYLVPHRLRYRQQLVEARTDDRFSARLRVLRVARAAGAGAPVAAAGLPAARVLLHPRGVVSEAAMPRRAVTSTADAGRAGRGDSAVNRPHPYQDGVNADAARRTAAAHAQRAADLARRAAAARRRALLTVVLAAAVAGGWAGVASGASLAVGIVPTVLLVGVLGLGRRAAVAGARADAAWAASGEPSLPAVPAPSAATSGGEVARSRRHTVRTVGRAVRASEASTEVMARVPVQARHRQRTTGSGADARADVAAPAARTAGAADAPATARSALTSTAPTSTAPTAAASAEEGARTDELEEQATWVPVPVPPPAYTLKPAARRGEPAPLDPESLHPSARPAAEVADTTQAPVEPAATTGDAAEAPAATASPGVPAGPTSSLDLNAILARRRASGE